MKNVDIFTRKYKPLDIVYNKQKDCLQMVLSEIPYEVKEEFEVPKLKRAYICSAVDKRTWDVELGENLRIATIYDKK